MWTNEGELLLKITWDSRRLLILNQTNTSIAYIFYMIERSKWLLMKI
jgi:hypothetical protein